MIFKIHNPLGAPSYIFTEADTVVPPGVDAVFGTEADAVEKLRVVREAFLAHEDYRFPMAKVIVNGNDTTWAAVDPSAENADGDYRVFNHNTGQYEAVMSLSECLVRRDSLKLEFARELGLTEVQVVDGFEAPSVTTVHGAQDL